MALTLDADIAQMDLRYMSATLSLARRSLGHVWPNPSVGAILVHPSGGTPVIVGRGVTQPPGGPHAEVMALRQAGDRAQGATCYVTLEPCSHYGRTGPCAVALPKAGVTRVVIGLLDPNPRVAGRGVSMLQSAGVEVVSGVAEAACARLHAGHVRRLTDGRPHVILKMAVSRDGFIGREGAGQVKITGEDVFRRVHIMRAECDGILVGVGTAIADDPALTCRLPGLGHRSPVRVILDTNARLPLVSRLVRSARDVPVWVVVSANADADRISALADAGCTIIRIATPKNERVDLSATLRALGQRGLTRLMVEGGARIARAMLDGALADEIVVSRSNVEIGAGGIWPLFDRGIDCIERDQRYVMRTRRDVGADVMTSFERREA